MPNDSSRLDFRLKINFLPYINDETPELRIRIFMDQNFFEMLDLRWEYVLVSSKMFPLPLNCLKN
jgi:hypothetical protein